VVALEGHAATESVRRIVPLPDGRRVVTACYDGAVRVFCAATGERTHELAGHEGAAGAAALAALGGDIVASGGGACRDDKIITWAAAAGARLETVAAGGGGVCSIAALGDDRFAVGTRGGDVVVYAHSDGRDVVEVRRVARAHGGSVRHMAARGRRLATCSSDGTAAVWAADARARLAVLDGHTDIVNGVAMSGEYIATGSADRTVRLYGAGSLQLVRVLAGVHANSVFSVALIGADHLLSASSDRTLCVTSVSAGAEVARVHLAFHAQCAAVACDGRLAVSGSHGGAALVPAPAAAAAIVRAHALALFPAAALAAAAGVGEDVAAADGGAAAPPLPAPPRDGTRSVEAVSSPAAAGRRAAVEALDAAAAAGGDDSGGDDSGGGGDNGGRGGLAAPDGGCSAVEAATASLRSRIAALEAEGVDADVVGGLSRSQLASVLAAFMISYEASLPVEFALLQRCLARVFDEQGIAGRALVGEDAVPDVDFYEAVVDGLRGDAACRASLGYKARLRAFSRRLRPPPGRPGGKFRKL
jgi:hypothetical protein